MFLKFTCDHVAVIPPSSTRAVQNSAVDFVALTLTADSLNCSRGTWEMYSGVVSADTPIWPSWGVTHLPLAGPPLRPCPFKMPQPGYPPWSALGLQGDPASWRDRCWRALVWTPWRLSCMGPPVRDTRECSLAAGFPCRAVC